MPVLSVREQEFWQMWCVSGKLKLSYKANGILGVWVNVSFNVGVWLNVSFSVYFLLSYVAISICLMQQLPVESVNQWSDTSHGFVSCSVLII